MTIKKEIQQKILATKQKQFAKKPNDLWQPAMLFSLFLGCCILGLSAATFWGFYNKAYRPITPIVNREPSSVQSSHLSRADLDDAVSKLNVRLDRQGHRIWLLAVANNENANIAQRTDAQFHASPNSGFIVFDENWKINRMPQTLNLDEQQRRDLQK